MPLDSQQTEPLESTPEAVSALEHFARSFAYEGRREITGLTQLIAPASRQEDNADAPAQATTTLSWHAQMFGRAAADLIPIIATGAAVRFGVGKIFSPIAKSENLLFKRSVVGLNLAESATTGFTTGFLFQPSESAPDLLLDRTRSGIASALSFTALTGINAGTLKLSEQLGGGIAARVLANPLANGLISGAPGGFASAQLDSVLRQGTFSTDTDKIGQSIYEMTLLGGVLGGFTAALAKGQRTEVRSEREHDSESATPLSQSEKPVSQSPTAPADARPEPDSPPGKSSFPAPEELAKLLEKATSGQPLAHSSMALPESLAPQAEKILSGSAPAPGAAHLFELQLSSAFQSIETSLGFESLKARVHLTPPWDELPRQTGASHRGTQHDELVSEDLEDQSKEAAKAALTNLFGADSPQIMPRLEDYPQWRLTELVEYLNQSPQSRIALIKSLPETATNLTATQLQSIDFINSQFGSQSAVAIKLKELSDHSFQSMVKFIEENPETRSKTVSALVAHKADSLEFDADLLRALERIEAVLGPNSDSMKKVLQYKNNWLESYNSQDEFDDGAKDDDDLANWADDGEDDAGRGSHTSSQRARHNRPLPGTQILSKYDLRDLAAYLEANPPERKSYIEKIIAREGSAADIDADRLAALEKIEATYGSDSPLTAKLLKLEKQGLPLFYIGQNLNEKNNAAPLIEKLVESGAGMQELSAERISGLNALNTFYGEDSPTMQRLLELEKDWLELDDLRDFITRSPEPDHTSRSDSSDEPPLEDSSPETVRARQAQLQQRQELVKRLVAEGADCAQLTQRRLLSYLQLSDQLAQRPELMHKVLEAESKGLQLSTVSDALKPGPYTFYRLSAKPGSDLKLSQDLLEKLLDSGQLQKNINSYDLVGFQVHLDTFGSTGDRLSRAFELQREGLDLISLSSLANENSGGLKGPIAEMLDSGFSAAQLKPARLKGLEQLKERFSQDRSVVKRLLALEPNDSFLEQLGYLSKEPAATKRIEALVKAGATVAELEPDRLVALTFLEKKYADRPQYLEQIIALEKKGVQLQEIANFLAPSNYYIDVHDPIPDNLNDPADTEAVLSDRILAQAIRQNVAPEKLTFQDLKTLRRLSEHFGSEPQLLERITALGDNGLNLNSLREFVDEDPTNHKILIATMIKNGATARDLAYKRMQSLSIIIQKLNPDKSMFDHLFQLESQGLKLSELTNYIAEEEKTRIPQIKSLLEQEAPIKALNIKQLQDASMLERLRTHFPNDEPVLARVTELQQDGLSASRLLRYIDAHPQTRRALVAGLVADAAEIRRFNDHMNLAVFPDNVATALIESANGPGMSVVSILGHLKDWRSGSHFRTLLIERVHAGASIAKADLIHLAARAREESETKPEAAAIRFDTATPQAVPSRARKLAAILQEASKSIDETIPADQPIVLLGRDNWPLFPLLKTEGRDVQYFLWSRLHEFDNNTAQQWLKEVPAGAAVIDTGYQGSILDAIKRIDPTASGYLLSSMGKYPQLLKSTDHSDMVQTIEYFPKLIGRSRTYTENGGVISKSDNRDSDEAGSGKPSRHHRWLVQGANRDMLRALKLTDWEVWRYSEYVGLTPRERLGLNSNEEVQRHYEAVARSRQNTVHPDN